MAEGALPELLALSEVFPQPVQILFSLEVRHG